MRAPACRTMLLLTLAFCGLAPRAWPQSNATSLGDVARQKPAQKARFVFTDDNLPFRRTPPATPDSTAKAQADPSKQTSADASDKNTPASDATPKADPADELRTARQQLQDLLAQEHLLNAQIADLRQQVSDAPPDSRRDVLNEVLETRTSELDGVHTRISAAQTHLLDLLGKQDDQAKPPSAGTDKAHANPDSTTNADEKPAAEAQAAETASEQNSQ